MRTLWLAVALAAVVGCVSACGAPSIEGVQEVRAEAPRAPAGTDDQLRAVVAGDREFALGLYHQLSSIEDGNFFYSPYSIASALSMAYAGARANTAAQLDTVLGAGDDPAAWHAGRNGLDLALAAARPVPFGRPPLKLEATNGIFGQSGYDFEAEFLRVLAANYGAGLQTVDYRTAPEQARGRINAWVNARTNGRIRELLGTLDPLTRLVLVNAIYFKAEWVNEFDANRTGDRPFNLIEGGSVDVSMMSAELDARYAAGDGWQAVKLPYVGDASMLVVVPELRRFGDVESQLSAAFVAAIEAELAAVPLDLRLPKWESESRIELEPQLRALGIVDAFEPDLADFSAITSSDNLSVSAVQHQANVTVGEKGTEASAATAVILETIGAPIGEPERIRVTVDRPFVYLIIDDPTGEVLFAGRVLDPTAG